MKRDMEDILLDLIDGDIDIDKAKEELLFLNSVMPSRLTVEQGHKGLLVGEFNEYIEIEEGEFTKVPVTWSNIKDIYKKIVAFHSA
tara:strand:+ start:318 stop:575 length:258 start_codon:yes stop_codon:yes gene_type:complete